MAAQILSDKEALQPECYHAAGLDPSWVSALGIASESLTVVGSVAQPRTLTWLITLRSTQRRLLCCGCAERRAGTAAVHVPHRLCLGRCSPVAHTLQPPQCTRAAQQPTPAGSVQVSQCQCLARASSPHRPVAVGLALSVTGLVPACLPVSLSACLHSQNRPAEAPLQFSPSHWRQTWQAPCAVSGMLACRSAAALSPAI